MAKPFDSGALRGNMAESLARRPSIALATTPADQAGQFTGRAKLVGACTIEVGRLVADEDQPRKSFSSESIERLASSIRTRGQLVPILARWSPEIDRYVIVDGERRFRAAIQAGLANLAAVDVTHASAEDVLEIQLVTNALREDVQPVEQARSYRKLMEAKGYSQRQLAERLSVDHTTITRALAMLSLPGPIQEAVDAGEIRPQTAYELSRVDDPSEQAELAERARAGDLKREELRQRVTKSPKGGKAGAGGRNAKAAKLPSARTFRTASGIRITAERGRGVDPLALVEALREALGQAEAEVAAVSPVKPDAA